MRGQVFTPKARQVYLMTREQLKEEKQKNERPRCSEALSRCNLRTFLIFSFFLIKQKGQEDKQP